MRSTHPQVPEDRGAALGVGFSFCAAVLVTVALAHADRTGAAGGTILGWASGFMEAWIAAGGWLRGEGGAWIARLRLPASLLLGVWLGARIARRVALSEATRLPVALALAALAQAWLGDRPWLGAALLAAAVPVLLWRRDDPPALGVSPPSARVLVASLLLLALFLAAALYRLDLYPPLYFDERAYLRAARMQAGLIEPGTVIAGLGYRLAQFQVETIPFGLQVLFVHWAHPDPLSTRLASVFAVFSALAIATLALRRRLGGGGVVVMLFLTIFAPLGLAYARAGFYIGVSILHGAVCFAALLRLLERWDRTSGVLLGVLLGTSLYHYQLSWFAPLLCGGALLLSPEPWRRRDARRALFYAAVPCALLTLVGVATLWPGLTAVGAQTFDRAVWGAETAAPPGETFGLAVPRRGTSPEAMRRVAREAERRGLARGRRDPDTGAEALAVSGPRGDVRAVLALAADARMDVIDLAPDPAGMLARLAHRTGRMLRQLVRAPDWESAGRWIAGPLLNPLVTPLVFVGLVEAFRRRREALPRTLAVWVVGAALLPAALGGALPRRAVLVVPFVAAVASLPLLLLARRAVTLGRASRSAATVSLGLFLAVVLATDAHLVFETWNRPLGIGRPQPPLLELVSAVKRVPREQVVLTPKTPGRVLESLYGVTPPRGRADVVEVDGPPSPGRYRLASCAQTPPFAWLVPRSAPEVRAVLAGLLRRDFEVREEQVGEHHLLRVVARLPRACGRRDPGAGE